MPRTWGEAPTGTGLSHGSPFKVDQAPRRPPVRIAPSVRASSASNSVAVTLTIKNVAAGGEELRTVSVDTAATAKLLKPPLRRQSPGQHHPSLGGSRLALHAQAQPDAPQAPPCPITLRAVSEAKIGGAASPEAAVAGGDRMGWVHRV